MTGFTPDKATPRSDRQNRDGSWKPWSDAPWVKDCRPLCKAKTAAQAAALYKRMAGEVATEQGTLDEKGFAEGKPAVILRSKTGYFKLIGFGENLDDENLERERLQADTLQALSFWQIVAKDLETPLAVVKII